MTEAPTVITARSPAVWTDVPNLIAAKAERWAAEDQNETLNCTHSQKVRDVVHLDSIGKGQHNVMIKSPHLLHVRYFQAFYRY